MALNYYVSYIVFYKKKNTFKLANCTIGANKKIASNEDTREIEKLLLEAETEASDIWIVSFVKLEEDEQEKDEPESPSS